jgi:hypothetical protein
MRILMAVPHTLPSPEGGHGCPVMSWAMLKWLKESGHDVTLYAFAPTDSAREPGRVQARAHLKALGVALFESGPRRLGADVGRRQARLQLLRRTVFPRASDFMEEASGYRGEWQNIVAQVRPDALWLYTTEAVALAHGLSRHIPRLASVVDLDHDARALKRSFRPPTVRNRLCNLAEAAQDRILPRVVVEWFRGCEVVVEHSHASAQWLRQHGVAATYLPNPLEVSPLPADWHAAREALLAQAPARRILMVGHLRGVATRTWPTIRMRLAGACASSASRAAWPRARGCACSPSR